MGFGSSAPCLNKDELTGKRCYENVVQGTGYCKAHQKPAWAGSRWAKPKNWADLKRQVFSRDKGLCYLCGGIALEVEHKIPQHLGGSDALHNLAAVCTPCHKKKTQQEAQEAQRRKRI